VESLSSLPLEGCIQITKIVEDADKNQWKFKVLGSINVSDELPREERRRLLDNLIENRHLKEIIREQLGVKENTVI
jgi:uncharacterized Fe-S cluster-containing MiaB family protein